MKTELFKVDPGFLARYNRPGPRYTSYPPAPFFKTDFSSRDWLNLLRASDTVGDNISFYFHIPFCPKRCLYCGCNTETCASQSMVENYHEALKMEMEMVFGHLNKQRAVSQIHFGGGTPNSIPTALLKDLLNGIHTNFDLTKGAEVAIECDPNLLTNNKLEKLRETGFNRLSMGLQDFNLDVLKAVGRRFPKIPPEALIRKARELGFKGINLDLIYGLPHQTLQTFSDTLEKTVSANPDRIAVFGYAHLPRQMPHQRELEKRGLPTPEQRIRMSAAAHNTLKAAGYVPIGMDHFAKPGDSLALAMKDGRLHRNFQGYCTRETTGQVYAFGATGIHQLTGGYGQNIRNTSNYMDVVKMGRFPLERFYRMSEDDLFFREVINSLMCRGRLSVASLASRFSMEEKAVASKLIPGMTAVEEFIADDLVEKRGGDILVKPKGWLVVRCIAMAFDPLLKNPINAFSKTV